MCAQETSSVLLFVFVAAAGRLFGWCVFSGLADPHRPTFLPESQEGGESGRADTEESVWPAERRCCRQTAPNTFYLLLLRTCRWRAALSPISWLFSVRNELFVSCFTLLLSDSLLPSRLSLPSLCCFPSFSFLPFFNPPLFTLSYSLLLPFIPSAALFVFYASVLVFFPFSCFYPFFLPFFLPFYVPSFLPLLLIFPSSLYTFFLLSIFPYLSSLLSFLSFLCWPKCWKVSSYFSL